MKSAEAQEYDILSHGIFYRKSIKFLCGVLDNVGITSHCYKVIPKFIYICS